jgi:hypothetical protein
MMSKTVIAYIRWFDSSITIDVCQAKDAAGMMENESAGVLLAEDKKSITIALDQCVETRNVRCTLCIPKVNVRSIKRFKI